MSKRKSKPEQHTLLCPQCHNDCYAFTKKIGIDPGLTVRFDLSEATIDIACPYCKQIFVCKFVCNEAWSMTREYYIDWKKKTYKVDCIVKSIADRKEKKSAQITQDLWVF